MKNSRRDGAINRYSVLSGNDVCKVQDCGQGRTVNGIRAMVMVEEGEVTPSKSFNGKI